MWQDKFHHLIERLEMPAKYVVFALLVFYVVWFWKKGIYDGLAETFAVLKMIVEGFVMGLYTVIAWVFVTIGRVFRVIFATVRDFFISRI